MRGRGKLWAHIAALVALIAFVACALNDSLTVMGVRMRWTAYSMMGKSESDVIQALGPPKHVIYADDLKGRTVDYPWKNMNFVPVPTRPVGNKVLLYSKMSLAVYLYIDASGKVEHVASAGT